eukprot:CAMPEP_0206194758 /NCGR_PEP_ID=MMETSP0166-20121206/7408_1 /ASSEMBLY_ACC=CAM_ASM_000260 /TAXON_ID=95228 /ORGANISM="Vannella robusta, Strain DIVA3 518/3/11/1/6" /LENGTH=374 /DNA_ID=CAMNT_0053611833 /DNA_START=178 /DNA_END=1299 /DNA_ORIENTATION=-
MTTFLRRGITNKGLQIAHRQILFRSFTATPRRQIDIPVFVNSFKKNLRENIAADPELGGNLKRLQETKEQITSTAVSSTGNFKNKTSNIYESLSKTLETTTGAAQEKINKITNPILQNPSVEKTAKVLQYTANKAGETLHKTNEAVLDNIASVADPISKYVQTTQIAKDINSITTTRTKHQFVPDPSARKTTKNTGTGALIVHKETYWDKMTRQVSEKWNEMGESMGMMSYIVEKVDSLMTIVDSLSNSKLGRAEMKIRQQDPYFTLEALQDWVQQDLFPRFLQAKKLDEFLSKHTGEAIKRMWQEKGLFPLGYSLSDIQNVEVFPNSSSEPGFVFSIRSIVEGSEGVSQLHVLLGIQQNHQKVWALNEVQVVD